MCWSPFRYPKDNTGPQDQTGLAFGITGAVRRRLTRGASTSASVWQDGQPGHEPFVAPDTLLPVSAHRAALVALSAAALTAACAAGQHAATSVEKPTLDGTQGRVGSILLEGVALHAPTDRYYPGGADVPLAVYIVNNGRSSDSLTNVTSTAFTRGWGVVDTTTPSGAPSSPARTSASGSPGAASAGTPQQIGSGAALGLGLRNLAPGGVASPRTLVLKGLATNSAPLFPGTTVKITFSFAKAGQTTLTVPVALTTTPNTATLPGSDASAAS
jgi:hypothetical protein